MKSLLFFGLLISQLSFASDCSISVMGLETKADKANVILESKGYTISYFSPQYRIQGANYLGPRGEEIKIVNMFERGNDNRIAFVEKDVSFFRGFKRIEKEFLRSLPECK